jgi:hypothetical protein
MNMKTIGLWKSSEEIPFWKMEQRNWIFISWKKARLEKQFVD